MTKLLPSSDVTDAETILPWLDQRWFPDNSGRGIATSVMDMIESGDLPVGTRLPTVRDMALRLGTSPAAVADAWARLRQLGLVDTRRRGGTTVLAQDPVGGGTRLLDLSQATSDPALQPDLAPALAAGLRSANLHGPDKDFITPALEQAVAKTWPFTPQAWTTGAGGAEAAMAAYVAAMTAGPVVAIEDPASPRALEALAVLGATLVPVACDADGPVPAALDAALAKGATTFIYQPRSQVPTGHNVSPRRTGELASVVAARPGVLVIEEDSLGPLAAFPAHSIGQSLPDRILYVRAYCRAYGGDLKTAVIGGAQGWIDRVNDARSHGYNVTSRILQNAVAFLIASPSVRDLTERARSRYAARRAMLVRALQERGVAVADADGPILWVAVRDENAAILGLARRGITVGAGHRCFVSPQHATPHLRIASSRLPDDPLEVEAIAATIALAILEPVQAEYD